MKIVILTEILSTHSGSRAPIELAKYLSLNNEITLLAYSFRAGKKARKNLEKRGVEVILIDVPRIPFGKWLAAIKFLPYLKGKEIISFHGSPPTFLVAKLSGLPLVKTYYGTQLDAYLEKLLPSQKPLLKDKLFNFLGNQLTLAMGKINFHFSDQIVGISQYTRREAKRLYQKNIPFIYLGTDFILSPSKLVGKVKSKTVSILSVSRLTPYKGFHLLIKAFKKLNKEIPQARLILVGSAPKKEYLSYLKKIKNKNVRILIEVSDQKLARLYQKCHLYATCDRYLFFGLPLVEAAYFGKPSVALDFAAASEIIKPGQTGYVAKRLTDFTKFLKKLAQDEKLRTKLGKRAQERVKNLFVWPKIAREYEALFKDVLSKKAKVKKHAKKTKKLVIFTALAISLIFGLPHLLIPLFLGGFTGYQPLTVNQVPLSTYEEAFTFGAQAHEVCDGHLVSSDAHLAEYKNLPQVSYLLPVLLAGLVGCLTGSVANAFVIADFLLPPLIFLVVYFLLFELTKASKLSIFGGVLILTTNRLFQFLPPLNLNMAKTFWEILAISGRETVFLEFSRFPHPQFSFLLLVLHLYFLLRALKEKTSSQALLSGVFLGLLFYTYFYYWTFVLAGEAVLFLFILLQKNRAKLKVLLWVFAIGLFLSLPYWFLFFNFRLLSNSKDILERVGIELGRIRNIARTGQYLLFAIIFSKLIKKKDFAFWFLLSFLIGGVVCLNIQLLTGYTLQSWHWTLRALNPFSVIMLIYLLHQILSQSSRHHPLLIFLIILFLARAFTLHFVVAKNTYQGYTLPQTTLEAFSWLDKNTPNDSVILTPSFETNSLIPIYTHNNVFLPNGAITSAANQEITQRLLITYKIFGLGRNRLGELLSYSGGGMGDCQLTDNCLVKFEFWEKQAVIELYHMKYLKKTESLSAWSTFYEIPKEEQQRILKAYDQLLESPQIFPTQFKLDYLYYGPAEKKIKEASFDQYPWAKEVFHNQDVKIYKTKGKPCL